MDIKSLLGLSLLWSSSNWAAALDICDTSPPNLLEIVQHDELAKLARSSQDHLKKSFVTPTDSTCSSITYKIPEEKLPPGQSLYFYIPEEYRSRGVRSMTIGHRQDPQTNKPAGQWDDSPGLTSVQIYSNKNWFYWAGDSSGKDGSKFAEPNFMPEMENLYDWHLKGHINTKTTLRSFTPLLPEAIKMTSSGPDEVLISHLTLKIEPPQEKSRDEEIFSPGTRFTSIDAKTPYALGGGQAFKGVFPNARALNHNQTHERNLISGKKISSVEIALGDSRPDGIINSDGGFGSKGMALVSVGIQTESGIEWILENENVPPEGIIQATPKKCDQEIASNSKLIIKSSFDTLYIMGIKISYH